MMFQKMKAWIKESILLALFALVALNLVSYLRSPQLEDQQLPEFDISLIDGNKMNHLQAQGKPLVVYFWGSWCGVCTTQSPVINTLSDQVEVLSVAVGSGTRTQLTQYMKQHQYHFRVFNDIQRQWSERFKVSAFPTIFIYDAEGKLRFTEVGYTSAWGLKARLWWLSL